MARVNPRWSLKRSVALAKTCQFGQGYKHILNQSQPSVCWTRGKGSALLARTVSRQEHTQGFQWHLVTLEEEDCLR